MKKSLVILLLLSVIALITNGQLRKDVLYFPDAGKYKVLKGDFHQHTVFSDGLVWPTTRVEEAYEEDIDVICLTDHIEYRPHLNEFTSKNHNHSYDLAKSAAERYNIILMRSAEITREMAPGHLNIIDIKDANEFEKFVNPTDSRDASNIVETLTAAKNQGGFIFWNHTAYPTKDNKSTWHPKHEELKNKGLMMGIEIVNGERYEPIAFQWCLDYNLTILSNTDVHTTMAQKRKADTFKVMTLILARERTKESIMEALSDHRTVALWNNQLMGRKEHVEPIVLNAVKAKLRISSDKQGLFELENLSGIPFVFEFPELPEEFRIRNDVSCSVYPHQISALTANFGQALPQTLKVLVKNVFVAPDKNLEVEIPVESLKSR